MRGYSAGPTLTADEKPWPLQWESMNIIDDGHAHEWELVHLLADGRRRVYEDNVVRCATCHVPRCGHSNDADPCMERRHHDGLHIHLSGLFRPLGDILRCHVEGCRHTAAMCPDHQEAW